MKNDKIHCKNQCFCLNFNKNDEVLIKKNVLLASKTIFELRKNYKNIKNLNQVELKIFSQNGEDGIIDYLLESLSIQKPKKAPIKCSIVETFTPDSFDIVVFKDVLLTLEKLGITKLLLLRSILLKIIPVFGSDGLIKTFTNFPL